MHEPLDKDRTLGLPPEGRQLDPSIELDTAPADDETVDAPQRSTVRQPDDAAFPETVGLEGKTQRSSIADHRGQLGDYEIIEEIARGGMGVVYKARQIKANRLVALKMILAGGAADEAEIRRFYTEAQAAASLDHPNIVPVYDAGELGGQHFFSMGFVDGKSLAAEVSDGPLEPDRAARITHTVSEAIAYAHSKQIIHRDLKPANILLDRQGNPRVTDFGLAKQIKGDSDLTATGQVMGTPSYMPPEQALGKIDEVGPLSDVYSLGAVLYQLLTGRPPFRAASFMETLRQVLDQEPVPPNQLNRAIDLDLNTITLKALEKNPARRYASAQDLADDLERYLEHRPIAARRISATGRAIRWARRNRTVATLLSLTILFLVATTTVSVFAAIQFREGEIRQRESADTERRLRQDTVQAQRATTQNLYDAEILTAGIAYASTSGIGQVRDLVEHWSPSRDGNLLGWEWYFLDAVSHREQRVLIGEQFPHDVRWHPDGHTIALTGRLDEQGGIYLANVDAEDAHTGFISTEMQRPFPSICWDPSGNWVAGTGAQVVGIWEYPSRRPKWRREFPTEDFGAICYSPVLNLLAARSRNGNMYVLDAEDGSTIEVLADRKGVEPNTIGFSPNGRWLATALNARPEGTVIKVWETDTWQSYAELPAVDPLVFALAWSPDSSLLAAGGDEGVIQIYDLLAKQLWHKIHLHDRRITDLAWNPDNERLASCSEDFTIMIVQPEVFEIRDRLRGHPDSVRFIDWSSDGSRLISVGMDYRYRVWNLDAPSPDMEINLKKVSNVYAGKASLQWHPDNNLLATTFDTPEDVRIVIWDADHQVRHVRQKGLAAKWSRDGRYLAAVFEQSVRVYNSDGTLYKETDFPRDDNYSLDWHPDQPILAITSQTGVSVWDVEHGQLRVIRDDAGHLRSAVWSPDGTELAVGSLGFYLDICDPQSGQVLRRSPAVTGMYTTDIAWSPDGSRIASTALDRTDVMIWNAETMTEFEPLRGHTYGVWNVEWSPDGTRLASSGRDDTVRIWNAESKKLLLTLDHHTVDGIGWSPDGKRLAAVGKHGRLKIWDATASYEDAR